MAEDITGILYRIKENIKAVEGGDESEPTLEGIRTDYLSLLELIKLFLISERDSYYGYFLMNMQFRADFCGNFIAGIRLNEFPPVFEANPLLLCKFRLKEILYVVCHEIDHVVLNHPAEMVKANPAGDPDLFRRFNLAADAAVNDRIDHEITAEKHGYLSHPDGVITSSVLSRMFRLGNIPEMENYAYYFNLIKGRNPQQKQNGGLPLNGQQSMMDGQKEKDGTGLKESGGEKKNKERPGDRQPAGTQPSASAGQNDSDGTGAQENGSSVQGEAQPESGQKDNGQAGNASGGGSRIVTAANCGRLSDHAWSAGEDAEDAAAAVRELVNASVGMMSSESRGMMPGYFMTEVEKLNRPPVLSWQAILKKYVGTISAGKRKTRTRLNRRQPDRFDLSGSMDEKILKIVVAIDTSGSVDDNMIAAILNEVFAILAKRKHEVTIIECDAEVRRVYRAKTPADVKKKVTGRGGTCFSPVIEYVNNDRSFRDTLLIYFTDGYGESEIPRPRTYRNLWVVTEDARHLSVKEPYGAVLTL